MKRFKIIGQVLALIAIVATYDCSFGQSNSSSRWRYQNASQNPSKVCRMANKKRVRRKNKKVRFHNRKKTRFAEGGLSQFDPYRNDPTSSSRTVHVERKDPKPVKSSSKMTLEEKHKMENEVLKKNNLPEPTSEKHEQIRKKVERKLANFDEEKPLKLDPLYFVLDQDEFAFVDMDPFLVAVEYALQGKHVLIEGHTDAKGQTSYNVQLSIKRVERIRQLMIDMGVSDDHISVVGYGEEHSNTSANEDDSQLDRRVDFTVF